MVWAHALPNALIPVVTLERRRVRLSAGRRGDRRTGVCTAWLGRLVLDAISQRDYALVQGSVLFIAMNFLIVNLIVDMLYVVLDPRIRLAAR